MRLILKFIIVVIGIISSISVYSEGWKQLRPGNATQGQIFWERRFFCSANPLCPKDSKIHIKIKTTGEKIFYGFNDAGNFGPFTSGPYYVRMMDPEGNVLKSDTLNSTGSQGFIADYSQAVAGPNVLSPSGYWGLEFTPQYPGDYIFDIGYLDPILDGKITNFDVTVIDTTLTPLKPIDGRVYCKTWVINCAQNEGFIATMYGLPPVSIVTSINFNGLLGNVYYVTLNHNGTLPPPVDWITARKTKYFIYNYWIYPEYKIFLNDPDSLVYPTGLLGMIIENSLQITANCNGTAGISFQVNKSGIVEILIKMNPLLGLQPEDVIISDSVQAGLNTITWNGLNGLGQPVGNGTPFGITIKYLNGLTNIPMTNTYSSTFGLIVNLHRPTGPTPLLYWDDREMVPNNYNLEGCLSSLPTSGCHTWSSPPYNFFGIVNTWWYASTGNATSPATLFKRSFSSTSDTTVCAGETVIWHGLPFSTPGSHTVNFPSLLTACDSSYTLNISNFPTPTVQLGADTSICTGQSITFDAGYCAGCTYQWDNLTTGQTNIASSQTYLATQAGTYQAIVTGPNGCKGRDTVALAFGEPLAIAVSITATSMTVCAGTPVTFTATPVNPGSAPVYQWKVNGGNAGNNNPVFSYTPVNGDVVTCELLSSISSCIATNPVTSNAIAMTVNFNLPVSVSVVPSASAVCAGTTVSFTANAVNGGALPQFQWKVNGANAGSNSPGYSYVPVNGDMVTCTLLSNATCATGNPAVSRAVVITVNPLLQVSVSVNASSNPFCLGNQVTFTATGFNGGTSPGYQWKVNGGNVGTNSSTFNYNPASGDVVTCLLTSSEACPVGNPATSNAITMTVNTSLPAGVSVSAGTNPFCAGDSVTFTAVPVSGGVAPAFQWVVNGVVAGDNAGGGLNPGVSLNTVGSGDTDGFSGAQTFTYLPQGGDSVWCVMTSNLSCVTMNPATSNKIFMIAAIKPIVSFMACNDVITTVDAKPFRLKGGTPLGGVYSGPGVNSVTGIFTPSAAGTGIKTIKYSYTNVATCSDEKSITITVLPTQPFTCGNLLTDVRDGKQYKTFALPNGRCWMAENLEYGMTIDEFGAQTDNCLAERYVRRSSFVVRTSGLPHSPGLQSPHPPGPLLLEEKREEALSWRVPEYMVEGWGSGSVLNSNFDCSTVQLFNFLNPKCQVPGFKCQVSGVKCQVGNLRSEMRNYAFYQWDELMQYQTIPGIQGLCPPGWHVPTSTEWEDLLAFYNGPGQAGWPMKDTLLATGFHSVKTGLLYQNNLWSFISGANAGAMYWTSTASGTDRAVARGLNEYNPSVSRYSSLRSNGFGVRCCKD